MAGSRTTKACEPRQVRKEAAAANPIVCCGKPGHQFIYLPYKNYRMGFMRLIWNTWF